ncbi:MAG: hypothetical protein ROO73_00920 [Roseivirga sp.]
MQWSQNILRLYTWQLNRKETPVRSNVGFAGAQSLGVLYTGDTPEKHDTVCRFVAALRKTGKEVAGLCYTPQNTPTPISDFPILTPRDISLFGSIVPPLAATFVNTPFDYLFHVDWGGDPILDYLLAKSQARCRVGYFDTRRTPLFEMMVTINGEADKNGIEGLTTQMLHYIQLLKAP